MFIRLTSREANSTDPCNVIVKLQLHNDVLATGDDFIEYGRTGDAMPQPGSMFLENSVCLLDNQSLDEMSSSPIPRKIFG
jgi:hypothetical protein